MSEHLYFIFGLPAFQIELKNQKADGQFKKKLNSTGKIIHSIWE